MKLSHVLLVGGLWIVGGCGGPSASAGSIESKWILADSGLGEKGINSALDLENGKFHLAATIGTTTGENAQVIAIGTYTLADSKLTLNAESVDLLGADLKSAPLVKLAPDLFTAALWLQPKAGSTITHKVTLSEKSLIINMENGQTLTFNK